MSIDVVPLPQEIDDDGNPGLGFFKYYGQPGMVAEDNPKVPYIDASFVVDASAEQELNSFGRTGVQLFLQGLYSVAVFTKQKDDIEAILVYRADQVGISTDGGGGGTERVFDNLGNTTIVDESGSKGAVYSASGNSSLNYIDELVMEWNSSFNLMYYPGDAADIAIQIDSNGVLLTSPDQSTATLNLDNSITNISVGTSDFNIIPTEIKSTVSSAFHRITASVFDVVVPNSAIALSAVESSIKHQGNGFTASSNSADVFAPVTVELVANTLGNESKIHLDSVFYEASLSDMTTFQLMSLTSYDVSVASAAGTMALSGTAFNVSSSGVNFHLENNATSITDGNSKLLIDDTSSRIETSATRYCEVTGTDTEIKFDSSTMTLTGSSFIITSGGDLNLTNSGNEDIILNAGNEIRMSANIEVQVTSAAFDIDSSQIAANTSAFFLSKNTSAGTSSDLFMVFSQLTGPISGIEMDATGQVSFTGILSDRRAKIIKRKESGYLEKLVKVPLYWGEVHPMVDDWDYTYDTYFPIADEFEAQFPEVVTGEKNAVDDAGKPVYQRIKDFPRIQQILWISLIDMSEKFDTYVAKNQSINGRMETRIKQLEKL